LTAALHDFLSSVDRSACSNVIPVQPLTLSVYAVHATGVAYGIFYFFAGFLIILAICIFCYWKILLAIRRQARVMAGHNVTGSVTVHSQSNQIQSSIIKTMILVCAFYVAQFYPAAFCAVAGSSSRFSSVGYALKNAMFSAASPCEFHQELRHQVTRLSVLVCAFYAIAWMPMNIYYLLINVNPDMNLSLLDSAYYSVIFVAFLYTSAPGVCVRHYRPKIETGNWFTS